VGLCESEEWRGMLKGIMLYLYPPRRRRFFKGCQTVYLVAMVYRPALVMVRREVGAGDSRRMKEKLITYEDLARIFHQFDVEAHAEGTARNKARNKVRSRWSAIAKAALRNPITAAGGKVGRECGKSASAREAMARSAMGNGNRRNVPVLARKPAPSDCYS